MMGKILLTVLFGFTLGMLATDFIAPPVKKIIYVIPVEELAARVTLRCDPFYGHAAITVRPPTN